MVSSSSSSSSVAMAATVAQSGRPCRCSTPISSLRSLRLQTLPSSAPPRSPMQVVATGVAQQRVAGGRNCFLVPISSSSSSSTWRHGTRMPCVFPGPAIPSSSCSRKKKTSCSIPSSVRRAARWLCRSSPPPVLRCVVLLIAASIILLRLGWEKRAAIALAIQASAAIFFRCELVPYTERRHRVLLPPNFEQMWGSFVFDQQMEELKGQVFPSDHPHSLRVQHIFRRILETMEEDLGLGGRGEAAPTSRQGSRRFATHHLKGLHWEVRVVKGEAKNAYALPGGKIVVFSGILEAFNSDAEIAIILGHEIAHVVGRHSAESIRHDLLGLICGLVLRVLRVEQIDLSHDMINCLLQKPFSRGSTEDVLTISTDSMDILIFRGKINEPKARIPLPIRLEKEADRIGLLLSSGAGYDPRVAPDFYRKLGNNTSMSDDYLSTHPSGETRAKHLCEDAFMKRAIQRYEERIKGEFGFPQ